MMKDEILQLILKHSRNNGDYVPDYQFENLADSIIDYFNPSDENDEADQWEDQREAMYDAWKRTGLIK